MTSQIRHILRIRSKTLLSMLILSVLNGIRVYITPSQSQNSLRGRQSLLMHLVYNMTLKGAVILSGLMSSKACLLLLYKINFKPSFNPLIRYKIRLISKVSVISLRAY